jgi:hypothetical protein
MEVTGKPVSVEVRLYSDLGILRGTKSYPLLSLGFHQVNNIFMDIEGPNSVPTGCARAEIRVTGEGAVLAYASIIDNTTNDAIFTVAQKILGLPSESVQTLAVAAHTAGAFGTQWKTDLRLFNAADAPQEIAATYRPVGGGAVTRPVLMAAHQTMPFSDVLAQLFETVSDTRGALILQSPSPLVAGGRIYTGGQATYGQDVPTFRSDQSIRAGGRKTLLGLRSGAEFRTNLGLTEITGGTAVVHILVQNLDGIPLGMIPVELEPGQHIQLNAIFEMLGLSEERQGYATVEVTAGDGSVLAYASMVDNRTGDAVYIPAQ